MSEQVKDIKKWMSEQRKKASLKVITINFSDSLEWSFSKDKFVHKTKGFFQIVGISYKSNFFGNKTYEQPIIRQSEIGILGFIAKKNKDKVHLLFQVKAEPGNIGAVQLAPTLQSTKSNYKRKHGGVEPQFLNLFLSPKKEQVLYDQLQSEDGYKFYKKRNRNIILLIKNEIKTSDSFKWIPLSLILKLLKLKNTVNTDARSVLCALFLQKSEHIFKSNSIKLNSSIYNSLKISPDPSIKKWLATMQNKYILTTKIIPLSDLKNWKITKDKITSTKDGNFLIKQVFIKAKTREVEKWDQPMLSNIKKGTICLVWKDINGVAQFLIQGRVEPGNSKSIELVPSCIFSDKSRDDNNYTLYEKVQRKSQSTKTFFNSEEGGRFYKDENIYKIIKVSDKFNPNLPDNFKWLPLGDLKELIKHSDILTNELRSILSLLFTLSV